MPIKSAPLSSRFETFVVLGVDNEVTEGGLGRLLLVDELELVVLERSKSNWQVISFLLGSYLLEKSEIFAMFRNWSISFDAVASSTARSTQATFALKWLLTRASAVRLKLVYHRL